MSTVRQLVTDALRLLKVSEAGEAISAEEASDGLRALNQMISAWNNDSFNLYKIVQRSLSLTASDGEYTIGSGGDIDTIRPLRISSAYVRDSGGTDHPMEIIQNREWSEIRLKSLDGDYPYYLYYRKSYPLAYINLYPQPGTGMTLYIECWDQLTGYTSLSESISLPPGYERAFKYNLALEIAPEYVESINPLVTNNASMSKADIQSVNNVNTPLLKSEPGLINGYTNSRAEWFGIR